MHVTGKCDHVMSCDMHVTSLTTNSKTNVRFPGTWMMSWRVTIFECFNSFSSDASQRGRGGGREGRKGSDGDRSKGSH